MKENSNILASFRIKMGERLLRGILIVALFNSASAYGQSYQLYKELRDSWYYFDDNQRYQSFESQVKQHEISLTIDKSYPQEAVLSLSVGYNTSIYVDGKIIDLAIHSNSLSYSLDSLFELFAPESQQLTLMLFHEESVKLMNSKIQYPRPLKTKSIVNPARMDDTHFNNIFLIFTLITLMLFTYIKSAHIDIWKGYMKWSRIISSKDQGDAIYKLKVFEKGTLVIVFAYAMLSATVLLGIFYLSGFSIVATENFKSDHELVVISKWTGLVVFLFASAILKFILVKSFTKLFAFKGASRVHFYNHIRISILIAIVLIIIELVLIFGIQSIILDRWFMNLIIILLIIKSLLISIKLFNISSYRMFHLFSYLCATEIAPAIILVKIIFIT